MSAKVTDVHAKATAVLADDGRASNVASVCVQYVGQQTPKRRLRLVFCVRMSIMTVAVTLGAIAICLLESVPVLYPGRELDECLPTMACWKTSLVQKQTVHFKVRRVLEGQSDDSYSYEAPASTQRWGDYEIRCDESATPGGDCSALLARGASLVAYGTCATPPFSPAHMLLSSSSSLTVVLPPGLLRYLTMNAFNYEPLIFVSFCFDRDDQHTVDTEATVSLCEDPNPLPSRLPPLR